MALSNDLISQFVKSTKTKKTDKSETTVYGTIVAYDGSKYMRIDGSDLLTPIETTTDVIAGERVTALIKNHSLVVTGNVSSPSARTGDVTNLGNTVTASKAIIDDLEANTLRADAAELQYATIKDLVATNGRIDTLESTWGTFEKVTADKIEAMEASIIELETGGISTETLDARYAKIVDLNTEKARITDLEAGVADIDTLIFGSATGTTIQASFSNSVIAQLGDAQIKSAMIESIAASKITSGDIITNNIRVKSEDGSLIISDETMQISDENRVRVQIGKDASGDYSINIWDQNGNLMFSKGGITDSAIKDAIIRNDMVSDTANIAAHKLDIDSLFEEINGSTNTIKSTQIYIDDKGQTLKVAFKTLSDTVTSQGNTLTSQGTQISTIQGQITSKIWQQDINTATNAMSTQYSTLEQDLNSFKTTVGSTYTTKTEFNNLEIGGRNILVGTNRGSANWACNSYDGTHSIESYLDSDGVNGVKITCEVASTSWNYAQYSMWTVLNKLLPNTEYTVSFDMLSDISESLSVSIRRGDGLKALTGNSVVATTIGDETWHKYTFHLTTNDLSVGLDGQVMYFSRFNTVGYRIIKNLKLERGNRATDWTPAPEDVETRLATAETSISQNLDAINLRATKTEVSTAKSEAISQANSNTSNLLKNYSTTSEMNAAINLKADSITSSVATIYTTKDDFNALTIGGRNLFYGYGDEEIRLNDYQGVGGFTQFSAISIDPAEYVGKEFTVSFWAKSPNGNTSIRVYNQNGQPRYFYYTKQFDEEVGTEWKYYTYTFTNVDRGEEYTATYKRIEIYAASQLGVLVKKIKLEMGNRATDWTPAPELVEGEITNLNSRILSAESSITQLSNKITSNVTETTNLGTRMTTVEQTTSGLTTRIGSTETLANNAAKTATNYLNFSTSGLVVGDMTATTLGKNVRISSSTIDVRDGTTTLASFGADTIYLGKNSETAVINLCNGSATMRSVDDSDFKIYTDKRLVMSAYSSALLDCWRDSTHLTRISMQSADPDASYMWGGIFLTIYQDTIKNTFDMSGNTAELKIANGTNEASIDLNETRLRVLGSNTQINCTNGLYIGYDGDYAAKITLGYEYLQDKSIRWYWSDNALHDGISNNNGQATYIGPGDIGEATTTYLRGKYVRLYAHSGGAVYLGASGSTAVTSDRNLKNDILDINDKYLDFFDRLRPITYKYNVGHRDHVGFIAQEVEEALIASGLTTEQFAGLVIEKDVTLNPNYDSGLSDEEKAANETHYDTLYSLRYEEFISLLVKKVQSLQEQINQLRT